MRILLETSFGARYTYLREEPDRLLGGGFIRQVRIVRLEGLGELRPNRENRD